MTRHMTPPSAAGSVAHIAPAKPPAPTSTVAVATRFAAPMGLISRRVAAGEKLAQLRLLSDRPEAGYDAAKSRLAVLPPLAELEQDQANLRDALVREASEPEARAILFWMLRSIPSANAKPLDDYIDTTIFCLVTDEPSESDGMAGFRVFSALALAIAAKELVATKTFVPSVAELLVSARAARWKIYHAFRLTSWMIDLRDDAERVVRWIETPAVETGGDDDIPF